MSYVRKGTPSVIKRKWHLLLVFLLVSFLWPAGTSLFAQGEGAKQLVLIDGSGSMAGFFASGEMGRLHSILPGPTSYFINETLVDEAPAAVFGGHTFLNSALTLGIGRRPSILWIVTDNQPSVGGGTDSDRDLDRFYEQLRSDAVKRIYLFPLKLRFQGTLYTESDGVLKAGYVGQRGLLVYAFLLDDRAKDEFEESVHRTEERLGQAKIFIKPLAQNTVTSKLTAGKGLHPAEGGGIIGRDFEEGEPIDGHFMLDLTSQLGEIAIKDANIEATSGSRFQTGDFSVESIGPPNIDPKTLDLQPKDTKRFVVTLHLDPVHIKKNLKSFWNCMTQNRGVIRGYINITITVPKQNFSVANEIATKVSTDRDVYHDASEGTQSRIYRLNDLVGKMIPNEDIQPRIGNSPDGRIPINLEVKYPLWPKFLILGVFLAPMLLLGGTSVWVRRQRLYRLTWEGGKSRACPDFRLWPFLPKAIEVDRGTAAKIRFSPLSDIAVKAQRGFSVDDLSSKPVRPDGSEFVLTRLSDQQTVAFSLSTTGISIRQPERAGAEFDDLSYDGGGGSGLAEPPGVGTPVPPIRSVTTGPREPGGSGGKPEAGGLDDYGY